MSDRLDDKITAFVIELVDDPPPAPDIDLDAARCGAPVEPTVRRFRLRDLAVAAGAFVAVIAVIGAVALVPWSGDSEPLEPDTTMPPATTTVPTTTTTVPATPAPPALFPPLAASELLTTDDLPPQLDWLVFDESTHDGDSIAGWGIFEHGVLAIRCEGGITYSPLDPAPASQDRDVPFVALEDRLFKAMYADTAVFGEALYADTPETVANAFNIMKTGTIDCLGSEITGWTNGGESSRLVPPPVGDDSIAIKVKSYLNNSKTRYDLFRLAIIRDGTRLLIVEEHESVLSQHDPPQDDPPRVSDAEFMAVVQTAVARLETTISTTVPSDQLAMELLQPGDLPAGSSWKRVPDDDETYWDPTYSMGPVVLFCADPTLVLSEYPWKLTATSPLIELSDGPVAATNRSENRIGLFQELLYGDAEDKVAVAFDTLVNELEVCLATYDPTFLLTVDDGTHWVADRYDLPPTGDESFAIGYSLHDGEGTPDGSQPDMWLAIVRSGDRIMIIMDGSPIASDATLTASEFDEIVQTAADRLSP